MSDFMTYKICTPRDPRFVQMLVNEYNNTNISLTALSKKYHTDARHQLAIHHIPIRKSNIQRALSRTNCININWNCEKIETEEQAYIYGLLLSDGYVGDNQFGLRLKDRDLLEKVKNYFSEDISLQSNGNCYAFVVSSTLICNNLQHLGLHKAKTGTDIHIPNIEESLLRHFIRGYFDGDGTIFKCNRIHNCYLKSNICSVTPTILTEIQEVLTQYCILSIINKENRKGKILPVINRTAVCKYDMYRLFIRQKESLLRFYHFLYDNSTIYLERKRKIFEDNLHLLEYKKQHKVIPS